MKALWIAALAATLAIAGTSTAALAQQGTSPMQLVGDVKVDKQVVENGQTKHVLVAPNVVVPGDRLIFSTKYHNAGTEPVKDFVVTNPLPAGVMLADSGAAVQTVSVDGGKSWGKLPALTVADAQGAKRPAQASDVTHVRWTLPLIAPGASGTLTYNAIVR